MRLYHSSTILLTDGTILSMGGGGLDNTVNFMDGQIYKPDYLYNDDGTLADRPEITAAPDSVQPGEKIKSAMDTEGLLTIHTEEATLEDIFVQMTGRGLK